MCHESLGTLSSCSNHKCYIHERQHSILYPTSSAERVHNRCFLNGGGEGGSYGWKDDGLADVGRGDEKLVLSMVFPLF